MLSRDATRSSRRPKKSYGLMDLEQFQSTLTEMINDTTVDAKSAALLREQAEFLFRKVFFLRFTYFSDLGAAFPGQNLKMYSSFDCNIIFFLD